MTAQGRGRSFLYRAATGSSGWIPVIRIDARWALATMRPTTRWPTALEESKDHRWRGNSTFLVVRKPRRSIHPTNIRTKGRRT
jgi:hypothetical protein